VAARVFTSRGAFKCPSGRLAVGVFSSSCSLTNVTLHGDHTCCASRTGSGWAFPWRRRRKRSVCGGGRKRKTAVLNKARGKR
uniref:Uncharacterized protein n=1 Tax=Cyclopterus lumpus TaxID=8103 RepID=A0A8C2XLS2_CYCLU